MGITEPIGWWLLCGALVVAELTTGTFYLLMLALGSAGGALAAHAGLGLPAQTAIAAVLGIVATALWHFKRASAPRSAPAESNRDVNLDIGERIHVAEWGIDAQTRVSYRGSTWQASYGGTGQPAPGLHTVVALQGNRLVLAPMAQPN